MGTVIAPLPEQCDTTAETSEWERAGHKRRGSRGLAPGPLSPHFSGEMGTPPGRRAPGALRPEAPKKPRPLEGYAVPYRAPARDRAGTHVAGANLRRFQRDRLPMTGPPALDPTAPAAHLSRRRPRRSPRSWTGCGPGIPPGPRPSAAAARRAGRPSQ